VVIEMNPRVSRSSALASKATGFPIAKIAAKLAVGYSLDEIPNDITRKTPACFEPAIDYVVVKIPRWAFEKFPGSERVLGTKMKSVGEVMAIGRTFPEALQKGLRALERDLDGLSPGGDELDGEGLARPTEHRLLALAEALRRGATAAEVSQRSRVDPWFVAQIERVVSESTALGNLLFDDADAAVLRHAKRLGFSDAQLARTWDTTEDGVRLRRKELGVVPTYKTVDSCAGEFEASTPYHYSSYEDEDEVAASARPKVLILGAGPNRIGQGIEFDYCCVHAAFALRAAGFETIMVNCNPETASTSSHSRSRTS
jgi:carbamoyl-phosphate synthase large subunit